MQLLFATTLLVSAALLFVVEPMFAKMVLPLLGGSPSVWNTCLVFYQAALLAGYGYAHLSVRWLGPRRQVLLHLLLFVLAYAVLPIGVAQGWLPPGNRNPIPWLWMLLMISMGLPFFCISANAPLLQAWFAASGRRGSEDPYFLYAASNLGSMIGLAAYPLLIEPRLTLARQSWGWAGGFLLLNCLVAACAIRLWRSARGGVRATAGLSGSATGGGWRALLDKPTVAPGEEEDAGTRGHGDAESPDLPASPRLRVSASWAGSGEGRGALPTPDTSGPAAAASLAPVTLARRLRWIALALIPSSLLLGVTTHISTDLAAVPLLWVIPLMLYLLSFVLVFARRQVLPHRWMVRLQAVGLVVLAGIMYSGGLYTSQIMVAAAIHLLAFFLTAMVCHGELAADRPASASLTEFYFWLSAGGVLGGLFNALAAPLMFNSVLEYPLMVVAACLLRPWRRTPHAPREGGRHAGSDQFARRLHANPMLALQNVIDFAAMLTLGAVFAFTAWAIPADRFVHLADKIHRAWLTGLAHQLTGAQAKIVWLCVAGLLALVLQRRPFRFAAAVGTVVLVGMICSEHATTLCRSRSFFGVLRVEREPNGKYGAHRLLHGSTLHGTQSLDPDEAGEPWTYYHRTGPVGAVFDALERREQFRRHGRIGVVGLGTGSIAAYGLPGQHLTYFEIDPAVVRIARNRDYFTYLSNCKADWDYSLGDARLRLADEQDGQFDVLLVDAFSSDAIPIHLITRQALELYFQKLAAGGLLAVHISNRHLDLEPVLGNLAEDLDLVARTDKDEDEMAVGKCSSTWVVLARRTEDLGDLKDDDNWEPAKTNARQRVWTDDFSNVVGVMEWDWDWSWLPGWKWCQQAWNWWHRPRK
ncbi:MAG: fused MFS/spermidine synthase [Thermoguttaceae bacterium]